MDPVNLIIEKAKRLFELRSEKQSLEERLKEINIEKGNLETQILPTLMAEHEIEKMTIEGIGTLFTQSAVYAYIYAVDRDMAHEWFKSHGHEDLVKESVHHSTLKSWVKDQLEEGKEVPVFLNAKPLTIARIRST